MRILLVGGAGYIGSHMAEFLSNRGCETVVFDNLSTGHADAVASTKLVVGDLARVEDIMPVFEAYEFDAVMHFASSILVGESVRDPASYYRNNVANTLNLLDVMIEHGVKGFVFSSTAAIFGEPEDIPIAEHHPKRPMNPYGRSKWFVEQILADYDRAYGLKSVCLRYFNAAGAHPDGVLGERHEPETHLIPLVLQAASGRRESVAVYGRDYPTRDGTCVRDYVHVLDLCEAHWLALIRMLSSGKSGSYNLGNGDGFSVEEVIRACRDVSGCEIVVREAERRPGDPAVLIADSSKARRELGWVPKFPDLEDIVRHAWRWEMRQCAGE